MQTVRLSVPLLGLLLVAVLSLCSAASIGVKEERLPGGGGPGRVCVQDDKGNLVCGKIVVGPGSPMPPLPPPMMDFLLPSIPPEFHHEVRHNDRSAESKMLLPLDLFSLPSFLDDFSDESLPSSPLDDIIRGMGKAHTCSPVPGQAMADGKIIMDCIMAGDDLPGPVSMHVTYDLADLPDDFSIKDLVSRRGMDMLLPPPLLQMMADLMPSQLPALPLVPPPTKMAPPPTLTPTPTQQLEKAADKDKSKLDPFHEQMNEIRSSFDAVLRDAMEKPALTPGPVSGSGPAMHLSIDGDVSVLGTPSPNNKQPKY